MVDTIVLFGIVVAVVVVGVCIGVAICYRIESKHSVRDVQLRTGLCNTNFQNGSVVGTENFRPPSTPGLLDVGAAVQPPELAVDASPDDEDNSAFVKTASGVAYDRGASQSTGEYANSGVDAVDGAAAAAADVPDDDPDVYKVATEPESLRRGSALSTGSNPPGYEAPPFFDATSPPPPATAPGRPTPGPPAAPADVVPPSPSLDRAGGYPAVEEVESTTSDEDKPTLDEDLAALGAPTAGNTAATPPEPEAAAAAVEAADAKMTHDTTSHETGEHENGRGRILSAISEGPELLLKLQPSVRRSRRGSRRQAGAAGGAAAGAVPPPIEEEPPKLGEPPLSLPTLPGWMQPERYNPWVTLRRRPIYRTVVVQRDSNGELGFGLGIRAGTNPVVRRTKDPCLPDTVLDGDEILGVKGTAATNENATELFKTAGTTGAGFSVDVIRYIDDTETRSAPKPADDGDRSKIPAEVAARVGIDPKDASALVKAVGESVALQVASLTDPGTRGTTAKMLVVGDESKTAFLEILQRCPARHMATTAHTGPENRQLLSFPAGATVTVHVKRDDGWWGGTFGGEGGWFPSHHLSPIEADAAANHNVSEDGTVAYLEPSMADPLYSVKGWWEKAVYPDPMGIPWSTLLPTRAAVLTCKREHQSDGPRFKLTLADGSQSVIEVVNPENGGSGVLITEEWSTPPANRSIGTLRRYATRFAPQLAQFCEREVGKVVGNGGTHAMVEAALCAVGARPPLVGNGNFGQLITEVEATEGDILAFTACTFSGTGEDGADYQLTRGGGVGDRGSHVGIISAREGRVFTVWESGATDGSTPVSKAQYNMMQLRDGSVAYYRALPAFSTIKPKHQL